MRDWNLVDDNSHKSDRCLSHRKMPFQDSSERLRSLLHFLYESATYRDLTSTSTTGDGHNLGALEMTWRYKRMLEQVGSKAMQDLEGDRIRFDSLSRDERTELLVFHPLYDSVDIWEHPIVAALNVAKSPSNKLVLRYRRVWAASKMLSVFNKAVRARA